MTGARPAVDVKLANDGHGEGLHPEGGQDERDPDDSPQKAAESARLSLRAGMQSVEREHAAEQEDEAEHGEVMGEDPSHGGKGWPRRRHRLLGCEDIQPEERSREREDHQQEGRQAEAEGTDTDPVVVRGQPPSLVRGEFTPQRSARSISDTRVLDDPCGDPPGGNGT